MNEAPVKESRVVVELGSESDPLLVRFCTGHTQGTLGNLHSYALRTGAGWIFVDPVRPTPDAVAPMSRLIRERPVATVLTSDGHERFCYALREQWGTPVWGPELGQRDSAYGGQPDHYSAYGGQPDHLYTEADSLPGGLRAIRLVGLWRGDHALLWQAPDSERVLFTGDVLNGQIEPDFSREEHYRRAPGLYFGARPRYAERHANPAALKASLERLLVEVGELDLIAGSHGRPFRDNPNAALAQLIATIPVGIQPARVSLSGLVTT